METSRRVANLKGGQLEYVLRVSSRARRLKLSIDETGELTATVPKRTPLRFLDSFIREKHEWILEAVKKAKQNNRVAIPDDPRRYRDYKAKAFRLVSDRLEDINREYYGFSYRGISIRNQRTRWGSCSSKGNLNFNYRIAFLPPNLADYIIVHELCHLEQLNHSAKFWQLVARAIPDFRELRQELRKLGIRFV